MARNFGDSGEKEVIVKNVPVGVELKDQAKPTLGGPLNADGHDIVKAGNVEAKTLNGKPLEDHLETFFSSVKSGIGGFAEKDHTHAEFETLSGQLELKADKDHTHKLQEHTHEISSLSGTVSLSQIEAGDKLESLLARDLCSTQHTHPAYEKAIQTLDGNVKLIAKALEKKIGPEAIEPLKKSLNALEDALRADLKALEKSIPVLPKPEKNVIGIKRIHVPVSGTVQEIVGREENGTPVKVTVTKGGKDVKVGDALAADDILAISPANASVRLRLV